MEILNVAPGQELNEFTARIPNWKGWLTTFVVDENNQHVGADGTSKAISNQIDLQLLISLRTKAKVIVTTGATARAEKYKSSRFAPIAFLTRTPESLIELPAFTKPGGHDNLIFSSFQDESLFEQVDESLRALGLDAMLYEGGPALLGALVRQVGAIQLVLCVANTRNPRSVDAYEILAKLSPQTSKLTLLDDFAVGDNRITRWLIDV